MSDSNKRFVASYSGGKDSVFAIYRAIQQGLAPVELIITYNTERERSWFHGIPEPLLEAVSQSLAIPVRLVKTTSKDYTKQFEAALLSARESGADCCVFGDIDLEGHLHWCTERCDAVGLTALFPHWQQSRAELVDRFIDSGFTTHITVVDTTRLPATLLGRRLDHATVAEIAAHGADVCGENGEYHTFVSDGPIFKTPVPFTLGEPRQDGDYAAVPLLPR